MRFSAILKVTQAIRASAVLFGILGAAHGAAGCATTPASGEQTADGARARSSEDGKSDVEVKKTSAALEAWEVSGGASGDTDCSVYDKEFSATKTAVGDDRQTAEEDAFEAAGEAATEKCESSAGWVCRSARAESPTNAMTSCHHRGDGVYKPWYCTVTAEVECKYSVF